MADRSFHALTSELLERIERSIVRNKLAELECGGPAQVIVGQFGRAVALKVPAQPWMSGVFCFTHEDVAHLDEIARFFTTDKSEPAFYLAPMGFTPELADALTAARFRQCDFSQAVLYGSPANDRTPAAAAITIESVTDRTLDAYVEANVIGFEYPTAWHDGIKADLRRRFHHRAGHHPYLARYNGEPAGGGFLSVIDGVGSLGGTSVLPAFRGKGCHHALLHHRLHVATALGCDLIIGGARFGSTSFRNQLRAGLQIAYIESGWRMKAQPTA